MRSASRSQIGIGLFGLGALAVIVLAGVGVLRARHWEHAALNKAIPTACRDAGRLYHVGLLDDADVAFARIRRVDHGKSCRPVVPTIQQFRMSAALFAARADVYRRAAALEHIPRGSDTRDRSLQRAARALITSLTLDPFNAEADDDLRQVVAALGPPLTRDEANQACANANLLRVARLLDDAESMYAKALRSGHNTRCVAHGLRDIRTDEGNARVALLHAQTSEKRGMKAAARRGYLAVLKSDASLTQARTALDHLPAPDPRKGSRGGLAVVTGGEILDGLTTVVQAVAKHLAVAIVVLVGLLVIAWFAMAAILLATGLRPLRSVLDWLPFLRRFTRTRTRVAAFTPEDKGWSCGSVFAHYLPMPPMKKRKRAPQSATIDRFEASTTSDAVGFASVLAAVPNAGALAAAATWFRENAPRREARLYGQLLLAGPDRFGLRVLVVSRSGRTLGSETFWSAELPGPSFEHDDEDAARTALSIVAAAWAYDQVNK